MPNRLVRNSAIIAKIETTYGTDAVPTGVANAILVKNMDVRPLVANNVDRALLRPYIGGSEQLIGTAYKEISFEIELAGSGSAGVAPAWGPLLRACGFAETLIATTRVDYTPITTGQESLSIYAYKDGVRHILLGARGDWSIDAKVGSIPTLSLRFIGKDGGETANAAPALTLSGWLTPQVVTDTNTADLVFGGTVSPTGAPAITGGSAIITGGLELQSGNDVPFTPLIGLESIDITARDVTGRIMIDGTAAEEVTRMAAVRANTTQAISMLHGTVANRKLLIHLASAQLIDPSYDDVNGKLMQGYSLRCPPASGNDEIRIVTSF